MKDQLIFLSLIYGWQVTHDIERKTTLIFKRKGVKLTLKYDTEASSTLTVITDLHHPKSGRTNLIRKDIDMEMFEDILFNPRVHTEKGRLIRRHEDRIEWRRNEIRKRNLRRYRHV